MFVHQRDTDPNDPETFVLHVLSTLPGPASSAAMIVGLPILRRWSRRLWDAGARIHPDKAVIHQDENDPLTWIAHDGEDTVQ